ncbi:MAG: MYG1 family protein [Planctomycetota bacterium]
MPHLIGTHSGSFHADDVLAVALWRVFVDPETKVVRSRDPKVLAHCDIVLDVGGRFSPEDRRFDHHQQDYQGDRSSAGMVLDALEVEGRVPPEFAKALRHQIVDYVDAVDNGRRSPDGDVPCFTSIVGSMNNDLGDGRSFDERFEDAVSFAVRYVRGIHAGFENNRRAKATVEAAMREAEHAGRRVIEFEEYVPWKAAYFILGGADHPTDFVVFPTESDWRVIAIPPALGSFDKKVPLPAAWSGLTDQALVQASGIEGAKFCHKNLFIAVFETQQGARKAVEIALQKTP